MDIVQLISGIYQWRGSGFNAYLLTGSDPLLVDAGMPGKEQPLLDHLERLDISLKTIVLTHYDIDHVGSAKALREKTGARILVPVYDAPQIRGELPRHGWFKRYLVPIALRFYNTRSIEPDGVLHDGDSVGSWRVIHTPGHTPGHLCLYRADDGVLISGDAVVVRGGRPALPAPYLNWDEQKARESVDLLSQKPVDCLLPGHGRPIIHDELDLTADGDL